ncbi:uncharacterized protein EAF01_000571 [Botrytis porri]|uniref:uncharacterized protein n=1 Tax=Botrytis porri TaxID=87229 RepID=UPI00190149AB|nr:uncharacterized protein EAF01_000571 [Botrytis porri]KAF7914165.1 hypothetical protein EAF01_000571 [Botrytis porri]
MFYQAILYCSEEPTNTQDITTCLMSLKTIPFERWDISELSASCTAQPPDHRGSHQLTDFDSVTRHDAFRHWKLLAEVCDDLRSSNQSINTVVRRHESLNTEGTPTTSRSLISRPSKLYRKELRRQYYWNN